MKPGRIVKHLFTGQWQLNRAFSPRLLSEIEQAIKVGEAHHTGEVRFAVEAALDGGPLWGGQTARARAIDLFSELRIWDTEHNNGVLVYVLLADHAVEIVADRGVNAKVAHETWQTVCKQMESAFSKSNYDTGALLGIDCITQLLSSHFPAQGANPDELPNAAVVIRK